MQKFIFLNKIIKSEKNIYEVIILKYKNINELLADNSDAAQFFGSLPENVRKKLYERGSGINSLDELKHFANIVKDKM